MLLIKAILIGFSVDFLLNSLHIAYFQNQIYIPASRKDVFEVGIFIKLQRCVYGAILYFC